ncbi:MAG: cupin domain-containing protein [Solirubrobacteraceae bacterium]
MEPGSAVTRLESDGDERLVPLRRRLGVSSLGLNQIVLQPGQRGRVHRHKTQEEVYLVLKGVLTLLIEGEALELGADQLVRVAPELRRQLVNRGPEPLSLLAIGGAGEHHGRDGEAFSSWEDTLGASPPEIPLPPDLGPGERL